MVFKKKSVFLVATFGASEQLVEELPAAVAAP